MKLALVQSDIVWGKPDENLERARQFAAQAAAAGVDFLIFPEVFSTGFLSPEAGTPAEVGARSAAVLEELAAEHALYTTGSFPCVRDGDERPYNMLQIFGPEGMVCEYAKNYLFSYAGEDKRYRAGEGTSTVSIKGVRVTPLICYDIRFPELSSAVAEQTDLFLYVANWPDARQLHWESLLVARAIENQAFVAGVNRVGQGGKLSYIGGSMLVSPLGEVLAKGDASEQLVIADLEVDAVREWREEFPALRDRK